MAGRIRSIKPEWLEDERMVMASSDARVLSIALILMADDYGNGRCCKAAETDAIRVFVASSESAPIYVEADKPAALKDDKQPRWVCVLAPSAIAAGLDDEEGED